MTSASSSPARVQLGRIKTGRDSTSSSSSSNPSVVSQTDHLYRREHSDEGDEDEDESLYDLEDQDQHEPDTTSEYEEDDETVRFRVRGAHKWSNQAQWTSDRFCTWPQEIGLEMEERTRIETVEILVSPDCVPSTVELFVDRKSSNPVKTFELSSFRSLGSVPFDAPNRRRQQCIRQHKHIHLRSPVTTRFVRIVIAGVHNHYHNTYNQVRILNLQLLGQPVREKHETTPPLRTQSSDQVLFGRSRPSSIASTSSANSTSSRDQLRDKVNAILASAGILLDERSQTMHCKAFNELASLCNNMLKQWEVRRRACAQRGLQKEVEVLSERMTALADLGQEGHQLEQARRLSTAIEDFDHANSIKSRIQEVLMEAKRSVLNASLSDPQSLLNGVSTVAKHEKRGAEKKENDAARATTTTAAVNRRSGGASLEDEMKHALSSTRICIDALDTGVTEDDDDDDDESGLLRHRPMSEEQRSLLEPLFEVFGSTTIFDLQSSSWRRRRLALRRIHAMSPASPPPSLLHLEALWRVLSIIAEHEASLGALAAGLDLASAFVEFAPAAANHRLLRPALQIGCRACQDPRSIVREAGVSMFISVWERLIGQIGDSGSCITDTIVEVIPAVDQWRTWLSRLYLVQRLVLAFGVSLEDPKVPQLAWVMTIVIPALQSTRRCVRSAAIALVMHLKDELGDQPVDGYLEKIPPMQVLQKLTRAEEKAAEDVACEEEPEPEMQEEEEDEGKKPGKSLTPEELATFMWSM